MTTRSNLQGHEHYISWHMLPESYQDTILLARKLDIRYVWIDSLCITQDDDEEKALEIARMHEIFREAFLVIIAAEAVSPYAGYLENDPDPMKDHGRARCCWEDFAVSHHDLGPITVKVRETPRSHGGAHEGDACAAISARIGKRAWSKFLVYDHH